MNRLQSPSARATLGAIVAGDEHVVPTNVNLGETREQRVLLGGAVVAIVALIAVFVVMPFARHWQSREREIATARARETALRSLAAQAPQLSADAAAAEQTLATHARRVLRARSTTLAASALQTMLQDAADASHVVVTRLDVVPDGSTASVPAVLSAYGDITGVATLLDLLATGPRVVMVDKFVAQRNAALLGAPDVVQVTLSLHAPVSSSAITSSAIASSAIASSALSPISGDGATLMASFGVAARDSLPGAVIRGNIFSATRHAPTVPFSAPGRDGSMGAATIVASSSVASADSSTWPRLSGIVVVSGERRALMQLLQSDGVPQLYRVGDTHGGMRVERVGADFVVLSSRSGTRTLRLSSHPAPDSLQHISR